MITLCIAPPKCCAECGEPYTCQRIAGSYEQDMFCSTRCRKMFNNRRMVRGAELYDLVMAWRFERKTGDKIDVRGMIGRVASAYRDSDKVKRGGRKSWSLAKALERIPHGYGAAGDKR